jgi:hypothetical protein
MLLEGTLRREDLFVALFSEKFLYCECGKLIPFLFRLTRLQSDISNRFNEIPKRGVNANRFSGRLLIGLL